MGEYIGYAKVSSLRQSLDSQIDQLRTAGCKRIFSDQYTGRTPKGRTQLAELLNYLRSGDVVVVVSLDRLSRTLMELLKLSEDFRDRGAQLKSLTENLDTSGPNGELVFQTMAVLAKCQRKQIRERTMEGLQAARAQGRIGGRPPVLNDRQRKLALKLRKEGESLREIARLFDVSVGTIHRLVKHISDDVK